jgi:hypothetical protein
MMDSTMTTSHFDMSRHSDLIMEISENVDDYEVFRFMTSYNSLLEQLSEVDDGFGTSKHDLLMIYVYNIIRESENAS